MTAAENASRRLARPMVAAAALGLVHALVDAASLAVLYAEAAGDRLPYDRIVALILLYNLLAFGLQAPLGVLADWLKAYRTMAVAGLAFAAVAVATAPADPWAAAVLVALGNAMFHTGAGAAVLRQAPGRAGPIGVFIGPGAAGVLAGIHLGRHGFYGQPVVLVALASAAVLLATAPRLEPAAGPAGRTRRPWPGLVTALCVAALLVSVAARSFVGGALNSPWAGQALAWSIALVAAAVIGKMFGGVVADRIGWRIAAAGSLAALAAAVGFAAANGWLAVGGMFAVQVTTGVTVAAAFVLMPGRPGTAFGLASLALLAGAAPGLARHVPVLAAYVPANLDAWLLAVVGVSIATILLGLSPVRRQRRASAESVQP